MACQTHQDSQNWACVTLWKRLHLWIFFSPAKLQLTMLSFTKLSPGSKTILQRKMLSLVPALKQRFSKYQFKLHTSLKLFTRSKRRTAPSTLT